MFHSRKVLHWALIGAIVIGAALFGPGVYRGMTDNREDTYQSLKILTDVIEMVQKNYVDDADPKKMIENAIQGMVSSLDPHSSLLTPEELKELQIDTSGEFTGIGIHVTMKDNMVTVISPIEGTPAFKAGITAGDKIVKVDGTPTEDLRDAVKRMRGPKGTEVTITIIREGEAKPMDFALKRDVIPIDSLKSITLQSGYGYVWITHFRENTYDDLVKALDKLENAETPLKGLVLDLRDNPGGVLDQALRISDLFLEDGVIMTSKGRLKRHTRTYYASKNDSRPRTYPIVVLINGGSASASEIVAGALQDQKRALILGTTSFGKGSVQSIENLRDGYALKLTIARYYTPSGRSIQAKGVEPDITVPYEIRNGETAKQLARLKEKDLANHLEGDPEAKEKEKPEEPVTSPAPVTPGAPETPEEPVNPRVGPLNAEQLLKDSQVRRALDILISHSIFQNLKNA